MAPSVRARVKSLVFDRVPGLLRKGPAANKRVALTFDDGPDHLTQKYLDCLDDLGVPATFFVVGEHADQHPELVREYLRRGHQVASHGYDHKRFTKLDRKGLLDQMSRTDAAIGGQVSGRSWVRPPHGELDMVSLLSLRAAGYVVALWSVDGRDYDCGENSNTLIENCTAANVGAGDVLLFHEGQQWTLDALPAIVSSLEASGLECVTMLDLFAR